MDRETLIPLILSIVLFVACMLIVVLATVRRKKRYHFSVHGHEVLLVCDLSFSLFVDGKLEDQIGGRLQKATLRATIDGEEFKAFVTLRSFRFDVAALYAGHPFSGN